MSDGNVGGGLELRCRRATQQSAGRPEKDGRSNNTDVLRCRRAGRQACCRIVEGGGARVAQTGALCDCQMERAVQAFLHQTTPTVELSSPSVHRQLSQKPFYAVNPAVAPTWMPPRSLLRAGSPGVEQQRDKGAVVEPARVSPPKRPRKKKQAPATDDDKKAVVTNRKTKASPDMQTDIQTPEDKMQLDTPEDKMQLDARAVAEDKMQLDERREEEQEQERVWRIQEQPTDDRPAQPKEHELNPVAVAAAQADLESVSREREISLAPRLSALKGLLHASPAEAELHAQYYPVSPAPMAAQQASSAPTWGTIPLAGPGLSSAVPVPVGVAQGVPGPAYGGLWCP
ncbi:hypothetical protein C8R43DRAFT_1139884 [Mycena crocata]|nr:hypothetical protein C8R43DRAFT_1139884 [Mycena crocata]